VARLVRVAPGVVEVERAEQQHLRARGGRVEEIGNGRRRGALSGGATDRGAQQTGQKAGGGENRAAQRRTAPRGWMANTERVGSGGVGGRKVLAAQRAPEAVLPTVPRPTPPRRGS
jgi:hypothetical protein